jgi:hypothetical protein
MDRRTRDYLLRAHNKVIAHYHQLLQASSLSPSDRERIEKGLAAAEAECETFRNTEFPVQFARAA